MKQQRDWYTGIDYFQSYKEQEIQVDTMEIFQALPLTQHERVELWYVLDGDGDIVVNGVAYTLKRDSFLCLYAHHLYEIPEIRTPLHILRIRFYIGLFMHAMWEKHPRGRNASLVYETPACFACTDTALLAMFQNALQEYESTAFGSRNMLMYIVLQIHMLFCRYALQLQETSPEPPVWKLIKRIIVASQEQFSLQDAAELLQLHPRYLNQLVKDTCGYSFSRLQSFGKIINACALLHFEDLSVSYIVDLLSYSSTAAFYRQFQAWTKTSPQDYQKHRILDNEHFYCRKDLYLQIMQYLYQHFSQDITVEDMAKQCHRKGYELEQLLKQEYHTSWNQELNRVRVQQAAALLAATRRTITSIAMDCGFSSLAVFERIFVSTMGCTPVQYRQKHM